ncbi:MAG: hypothetical protein JW395_2876 [Nitrospira sp.]|nr:hypothetical protein [Nitrospira sp.]
MKLFPLLPRTPEIEELAVRLMSLSVSACRSKRALSHPSAVVSPTGGTPASDKDLRTVANEMTAIAEKHGYPGECTDTRPADADWSEYLHRNLDISPHEAAKDEMWNFMTCILVPDLVRWRWDIDDADSPSERWITIRRRGRNCFGRLWWRSEILGNDSEKAYAIIHELKEDEFVQIMERPSLAGNKLLSRSAAQLLVDFGQKRPKLNRALAFREVQKRLLRMGAYIEFESLGKEKVRALISEIFIQVDFAIQRGGD